MTPATKALDQRQVVYQTHVYAHDPHHGSYGDEAAEALGIDAARVHKTLLAKVDDKWLVVAVVPVTGKLNLKALAKAAGGKKAAMAEQAEAERSTGYVVGGISPLGQRKPLPTFIDDQARAHATVYVSGGKRGFEIELSPADLAAATEARFAPLSV